jgi:hypothetical protein
MIVPGEGAAVRLGTKSQLFISPLQDEQSTLYGRERSWKFFSNHDDPFA